MDFSSYDLRDGIRFTWNVFPSSRVESTKLSVPLGCIYQPLRQTQDLQIVSYNPLSCRNTTDPDTRGAPCGAILNPFCQIDFVAKTWKCVFCKGINVLPQHYAEQMTEHRLPAEKTYTTMEYIQMPIQQQQSASEGPSFQKSQTLSPLYLIILDVAIDCKEDNEAVIEFQKIKECIQNALTLGSIGADCYVGFITYGTRINIYEIGFTEIIKYHCLKGEQKYSAQIMGKLLGLSTTDVTTNSRRFFLPASECEFFLNAILDDLQPDPFAQNASSTKFRVQRCTGAAISAGLSLLESCGWSKHAARAIVITSGACTIGPGLIVSTQKRESIRSHDDLANGRANSAYRQAAVDYYTELTQIAIKNGPWAVDVLTGSLDQVGIHEMRSLCDRTGGSIVMSDSYKMHVFQESFQRLFCTGPGSSASNTFKSRNSGPGSDTKSTRFVGYCATLSMRSSKPGLKICGAIGPFSSTKKNIESQVSDIQIGESGTCEWQSGALDENSAISIIFEKMATNSNSSESIDKQNSALLAQETPIIYVQFLTKYIDSNKCKRMRVTTVARTVVSDSDKLLISQGFDQDTSATMMAKQASDYRGIPIQILSLQTNATESLSYKTNQIIPFDNTLNGKFYDQKFRSAIIQPFGYSPDESAFYQSCLLRESVDNTLLMIQPSLTEYSLEEEVPRPVLLDSASLKSKVILVMDAFFHVVVWRGEAIQQWYDAKYHEREEYAHFRNLIEQSSRDAVDILEDRFPTPRFVQTYANASQARFLINRVNPSQKYDNNNRNSSNAGSDIISAESNVPKTNGASRSSTINTDDASIRTFMECLINMAVKSEESWQ